MPISLDPRGRQRTNGVVRKILLLFCGCAGLLLPGCAVFQQLDEWSRPRIRYVDPRDIGPDGLPNAKRRGFANKFIIYSEVPVKEFYGIPYYTSGN